MSISGNFSSAFDFCVDVEAVRLTLIITPKAMQMTNTDVPPFEISGKFCPDTGTIPVLMAM